VAHLWPDNWGVWSLGGTLGDDFSRMWIEAHTKVGRCMLTLSKLVLIPSMISALENLNIMQCFQVM